MTRNKSGIVILLVLFGLLAAGVGNAAEVQYVSLAEAEKIAFESSTTLHLAQLELKEAEIGLRQAEAASIMKPSPTMLMQAQAGLDLARQAYQMDKDNLALAVKTDFFNVLRLQSLLEIAKDGLESAERNLDVTQQKFKHGTVTQLDVIQSTRNVLNSQADLSQLKHNLELAEMKFRQTIGLQLNSPVLPERSAFELEPMDVDLDEDLAFALANRAEIQQLELAVAVAKKNIELADNEYTPALELEQAKVNFDKMETQLKQVKQMLTLEITQNYLAMKDAKQRIPVLEKGIEEAEELVRLTTLMYESDMIVANDLADTQIALSSARNDMVNAMYDYNLAQARYAYAVANALR